MQVREAEGLRLQRDFPLVGSDQNPNRTIEGVFQTLLHQQKVWTPKAILVVAGERTIAVDVGSAQRLLKIERYLLAATDHGPGGEQAHGEGSPAITRNTRTSRGGRTRRALVRPVGYARGAGP